GRDVAIDSEHPGTTRDALEVHLDLAGYPMTVTDTAGLRTSEDPVERIGIERAFARAGEADLVLWLVEPGSLAAAPPAFPGPGRVRGGRGCRTHACANSAGDAKPRHDRRDVVQSGDRRSGQGSPGSRDRCPRRDYGKACRPGWHPFSAAQPLQRSGRAGAAGA